MRKAFTYVLEVIALCVIYIILCEEWTLLNAGVGLLLASGSLLFVNLVLLNGDTVHYYFNIYYLIFIGYLIFSIIKSGIKSIIRIVSGRVSVYFLQYETGLSDRQLVHMLANAITLTPGTVTVDVKDDRLFVMQLVAAGRPPNDTAICGLERMIAPIHKAGGK